MGAEKVRERNNKKLLLLLFLTFELPYTTKDDYTL